MLPVDRELLFRVDALPGSPLIEGSQWVKAGKVAAACIYDAKVRQLRNDLASQLAIDIRGAWMTARVDDSLVPALDHIEQLRQAGIAGLGDGYFYPMR